MKYVDNKIIYEKGDWVTWTKTMDNKNETFQIDKITDNQLWGSGSWIESNKVRLATQEEIDKAIAASLYKFRDNKVTIDGEYVDIGCKRFSITDIKALELTMNRFSIPTFRCGYLNSETVTYEG